MLCRFYNGLVKSFDASSETHEVNILHVGFVCTFHAPFINLGTVSFASFHLTSYLDILFSFV